jgi:hypothetical protein
MQESHSPILTQEILSEACKWHMTHSFCSLRQGEAVTRPGNIEHRIVV